MVKVPRKLKFSSKHISLLLFSSWINDSSKMFEAEWKKMMRTVLIIKAGDKAAEEASGLACCKELRLIYLFWQLNTSGCTNARLLLKKKCWCWNKVLIWIPCGDNDQFEDTVSCLAGRGHRSQVIECTVFCCIRIILHGKMHGWFKWQNWWQTVIKNMEMRTSW